MGVARQPTFLWTIMISLYVATGISWDDVNCAIYILCSGLHVDVHMYTSVETSLGHLGQQGGHDVWLSPLTVVSTGTM